MGTMVSQTESNAGSISCHSFSGNTVIIHARGVDNLQTRHEQRNALLVQSQFIATIMTCLHAKTQRLLWNV